MDIACFYCHLPIVFSILFKEVDKLVKERRVVLVLVSHDPVECRMLCQLVLALENGTTQDVGDWIDVLAAPKSELLRTYGKLFSKE